VLGALPPVLPAPDPPDVEPPLPEGEEVPPVDADEPPPDEDDPDDPEPVEALLEEEPADVDVVVDCELVGTVKPEELGVVTSGIVRGTASETWAPPQAPSATPDSSVASRASRWPVLRVIFRSGPCDGHRLDSR
jgi:hypothetical protein